MAALAMERERVTKINLKERERERLTRKIIKYAMPVDGEHTAAIIFEANESYL